MKDSQLENSESYLKDGTLFISLVKDTPIIKDIKLSCTISKIDVKFKIEVKEGMEDVSK